MFHKGFYDSAQKCFMHAKEEDLEMRLVRGGVNFDVSRASAYSLAQTANEISIEVKNELMYIKEKLYRYALVRKHARRQAKRKMEQKSIEADLLFK